MLVTIGVGTIIGVFLTIAVFALLMFFHVRFQMKDLLIALGALAFVAAVVTVLQNKQKKAGFKERLYESMEKVADLVTR